MLAEAIATTTTELRIHYLHAGAERLPFTDEVFDLVFATMSMRHWTDQAAGIAEIGRVLTRGGVLVLADVFPSSPRQPSRRPCSYAAVDPVSPVSSMPR
jgi:ubiquinone/menaquinone biosynthesis C-methylase UbiE